MEQKRKETIEGLKIVEQAALGLKEEGMPYISVEAVLKVAQDALAVLTAEQERSSAPVGTINTNKYALHTFVGEGKTDDGKKLYKTPKGEKRRYRNYGKEQERDLGNRWRRRRFVGYNRFDFRHHDCRQAKYLLSYVE